jgi:sulfoxide reductase heme-binding subunit YedZ
MTAKAESYGMADILTFAAGSLAGALLGTLAVGQLMRAMAAQAPGFWFVSRAAGLVGYALLWLSTAWGVMLSSKSQGKLVSGPLAYAAHNFTSWLALGFSAVHGLALLGDRVVPFTIRDLAVPFAASYQPLLSGLGTLSLYVGILVSVTFYMQKRIGFRTWHAIHLLSYLMFIGATIHSVGEGTDSAVPAVRAMYLVAGGSVLFLTLVRLFTARSPRLQQA